MAPDRFIFVLNKLFEVSIREANIYNGFVPRGSLLLGLIEGYNELDISNKLTNGEYLMLQDAILSCKDFSVYAGVELLNYLNSNYSNLIKRYKNY